MMVTLLYLQLVLFLYILACRMQINLCGHWTVQLTIRLFHPVHILIGTVSFKKIVINEIIMLLYEFICTSVKKHKMILTPESKISDW